MLIYATWAVLALIVSGIIAWTLRYRPRAAGMVGAAGCFAAAALGLWAATGCLILRENEARRALWNVPHASFGVGLDSLTALFLVPLFLVGAMAAWAALRRLPGDYAANHPHEHWLFLNLTLASTALALLARNAVLFLFAWELMTVASFLLIENDQRHPRARGGWAYLTAGHIGGACLFAMFALLGAERGVMDFAALRGAGAVLAVAFLLAFAGFGGKMGLAPFQNWYPESYPQSPSHVGAVLSGVIGNMGLYGILRFLQLTGGDGPPPAWWGYLMLLSGLAAGVIGAGRALVSRDLFRLLGWSSVENFGLMAAGVGVGLLSLSLGNTLAATLGFAAALFHMLNHSVSKALLFLSAGSVQARSGTRSISRMGGLLRRLPLTGVLFLTGALGAAAVPPSNGFASELLLLLASYRGALTGSPDSVAAVVMFVAVVAVAVTGGLAVAAFLKAFGFIFLGNPAGAGAASDGRERRSLLGPHLVLALAAVALAALSPRVLAMVRPAAETITRLWRPAGPPSIELDVWTAEQTTELFLSAFAGCWLVAGCAAVAYLLRRWLFKGRQAATGPTWDCGYDQPSARMQYTAESFVRPLAETVHAVTRLEDREHPPQDFFPVGASFDTVTPGLERSLGFSHLFRAVARAAARVRVIQEGRVQLYLLYMAAVLVVLLLWKL